jgi:hypothetical protein
MPTSSPIWLQILALFGDSLSGLSALATLAVAIWAVKKTLPTELKKFRQTKREERRAEVAEETWAGAFRLIIALRTFADPIRRSEPPKPEEGKERSRGQDYMLSRMTERTLVAEASNALIEVWALAELHLDESVDQALKRLWQCRADLLTAERMHALNLDQPGSDMKAFERLHGDTGKKKIAECEQELKSLLGPIARHDLEHSIVPATQSAPTPTPAPKAAGT